MKKIFVLLFSIILVVGLFVYGHALAHPGRTDSYGCHTCRTNCSSWGLSYGEYHCHRAKVLPQPEEPIKSHYGEGGTGYTEPAPEYKAPTPQVEVPRVEIPSPDLTPQKESTDQPSISPVQPSQKEEQIIEESTNKPESVSQTASVSVISEEEPRLSFWQRILRWFGFLR